MNRRQAGSWHGQVFVKQICTHPRSRSMKSKSISSIGRNKNLNLKNEMRGVCSCKMRFLRFKRSDKEGGLWWGREEKRAEIRACGMLSTAGVIFLTRCPCHKMGIFFGMRIKDGEYLDLPGDLNIAGKLGVSWSKFYYFRLLGERFSKTCIQEN